MSQPDTTKRTVAADAGYMENTVPAGKPYATAKSDTCRQTVQAAAGETTQDKPKVIKLLPRTQWAPMSHKEKKRILRICEALAEFPELTSDEETFEEEMEAWMEMC